MRLRPVVMALLIALVLVGAGALVTGSSGNRVGVSMMLAGLIIGMLAAAPGYDAEGRHADARGVDGFRPEPHGFERPRDEGRLL